MRISCPCSSCFVVRVRLSLFVSQPDMLGPRFQNIESRKTKAFPRAASPHFMHQPLLGPASPPDYYGQYGRSRDRTACSHRRRLEVRCVRFAPRASEGVARPRPPSEAPCCTRAPPASVLPVRSQRLPSPSLSCVKDAMNRPKIAHTPDEHARPRSRAPMAQPQADNSARSAPRY